MINTSSSIISGQGSSDELNMPQLTTQFGTDLDTKPDPKMTYIYEKDNYDSHGVNFTHLMKLVLCTKFYPDAFKKLGEMDLTDINAKNSQGWTALHIAAANSSIASTISTVQWLIDMGADINAPTEIGYTALHIASRNSRHNSNNDTVQLLIKANANIDACTTIKTTPLHLACVTEANDTVKLLIDGKADVNFCNLKGQTALHLASKYSRRYSNDHIVELLINASANIDARCKRGRTALHLASKYSRKFSSVDTVRLLINSGASINIGDNDYQIALHLASRYSRLASDNSAIELLIRSNSNVNALDDMGYTPLHTASRWSNYTSTNDTVELLIKMNADLNARIYTGESALHIASLHSFRSEGSGIDTMKILIDAGADVNACDCDDRSVLRMVCNNIARQRQRAYARRDSNGVCTMHCVRVDAPVRERNITIPKLLIDANADVNMKNSKGFILDFIAKQSDSTTNRQLIDLLIAAGANIMDLLEHNNPYLHEIQSKKSRN